LSSAAQNLVALATALRKTLDFVPGERVRVSWSGGVLSNEPIVREAFIQGLAQAGPFAPVDPLFAPGYGAALYARRMWRPEIAPDDPQRNLS
jgi:hypothetical protein